jgi:hypothetical protein
MKTKALTKLEVCVESVKSRDNAFFVSFTLEEPTEKAKHLPWKPKQTKRRSEYYVLQNSNPRGSEPDCILPCQLQWQ